MEFTCNNQGSQYRSAKIVFLVKTAHKNTIYIFNIHMSILIEIIFSHTYENDNDMISMAVFPQTKKEPR